MDEFEEGQLSSDVQNSSKDDLEDDIENRTKIDIKDSLQNMDCVLCGNYACICDKNDDTKSKQHETEEGEIVESDNCSVKLQANSAIKPLLNKKQAKKRLQAFSSEQKSIKRKKNLPVAKAPKVVVEIETQYDENGEVTEDKLVIRKVPKIGPNYQDKAKSVISEIEEMKRHSNIISYNPEKLYPRSVVSTIIKRHDSSFENRRKYSNHFDEPRSKKRRSRSRERTRESRENDRNSSRSERHKSDRHSNSWSGPATTWPEFKASGRSNISKRKLYPPIPFNMRMQLRGFEDDASLIKGTFYIAHSLDSPRIKFYYKETTQWTKTDPTITYAPSGKSPENLFPGREELFRNIPSDRAPIIKEILNSSRSTSLKYKKAKKQTSQNWYRQSKQFCVEHNENEDLNHDETSKQSPIDEPEHEEEDTSVVNKSYGLSVLSENYQNHWGEESGSETGKKSHSQDLDVLPEDISADENDLDYTPQNKRNTDIDLAIKANDDIDNNNDQSPDIKTPDTDEYRSNWEVEEDPLIDYKSPQIWDSDDNSTLSRKASKKFHNNLYTNKKKFDFSDIAYNDKSNIAISNGLSDSFMNSFGYRRSTSPNSPSPEKHRKYKERHSDDSRSSKSKYEHFTESKRSKHMSKINLNSLEEDLELKRKSIFKNKPYDDYDLKRSLSVRSNHVDSRSKHWENDEDVNHYQHRREKIWEDKKSNWKDNDINEFRMQEKIKLNESLSDEKVEEEKEESTKLEEEEKVEQIASPPPNPPPPEPTTDDTSNNNSKLVSEYEEFMKTVGFEATVQDEIFSNESNLESKTKKSKNSKESSEESSDDEQKSENKKRRHKKKSVTSSSSSDTSSSSSSSDSSDSDSDSSDSSSSSSSSSSISSKEEIMDPLKIKVEKVSDDDSKLIEKMNQIKNSVKVEKEIVQEKTSSDVVPIQDSSIPIPETDSAVCISNTTISLTLTPSKRQQFKPLLLDNESSANVNTDVAAEDRDNEMDFTDIIMKRSREETQDSPEAKKQEIEYEKVSPTPSRERSESSRRSDSRRREHSRERSRNHYRDENHRSRRERSRDRISRRERSSEYRHPRSRHLDVNDRRSKYYDDKYYRSKSQKNLRRSRSPLEKPYRRVDDIEKYRTDREYSSNSPLDGFKRSLADSTISDSELLSSQTLPPSTAPNVTDNECKKTVIPKQTTPPSVDSPISPKRLSLDDRINQFLGIESEPPSSKAPNSSTSSTRRNRKIDEMSPNNAIYAQNSYDDYMTQDYYDRYANYVPTAQHHPQHYEGYHHPPAHHHPPTHHHLPTHHHHNTSIPPPNFYPAVPPPAYSRNEMPPAAPPRPNSGTQVVQVGNVLQVVPTELPAMNRSQQYEEYSSPVVIPKKEVGQPLPASSEVAKPKVLQVGNMIQIVPTTVLPEESIVPPPKPPVQPEVIKTETIKEEKITIVRSPVKVVEKVIVVDEAALNKKLEKEKRHSEREKRRADHEAKRKEKQKRRDQRLKLKTEKMIKQALLMETSESQVSDLDVSNILQDNEIEDNENNAESSLNNSSLQSMWPPPAPLPISLMDPPTKGILMKSGFSKIKTDIEGQITSELGVEEIVKVQKTVKFADGIKPGEGTSPSGGEELPSPPPPKRKLPKEQRYKKTKLKTKKKVKVKVIRPAPLPVEEDDSDDNLPPPPPPPGSPPPHLWPPKYMEPHPPLPMPFPGGPMPPHLPPFPHPAFPNGAHLPPPPPGFIPPPNSGPPLIPVPNGPPLIGPPNNGPPPLIPKNHLNSQPVFPPNMFPPIGPDGPPPPPPPYLEGRPPPPGGMNMPPGNMFVPKYSKMM